MPIIEINDNDRHFGFCITHSSFAASVVLALHNSTVKARSGYDSRRRKHSKSVDQDSFSRPQLQPAGVRGNP
jgi:hypothetical protein